MAIALSKEKVQAHQGIMFIVSFFALFLTNSVLLLVLNTLFPSSIVLGTYAIPYWWAIYHSMFKLTMASVLVMAFVPYYEWKNKVVLTPKQWMILYFFVNFILLWSISRFAETLGLGISSIWVLGVMALVFDMVQGFAMMYVGEKAKKYLK